MPFYVNKALTFLSFIFVLEASLQSQTGGAEATPHRVFANYMVCYATYGEGLEGYQREMREALAAGIDGFALNVGAWRKEPHYPRRVKLIFEAARTLGADFKLFFSVDMSDVPDVLDMIRTYARHPNQFTHQGRIVVSTFSQEGLDWKGRVLEPLRKEGIDVFFVPYFYPRPIATELPDEAAARALFQKHADVADGFFYFGAAGLADQLARSNTAYVKAGRAAHKPVMGSYTPTYWGNTQPDRRYYETRGGEGTAQQWKTLIDTSPDWVEIVTWNDFNESTYVCPIEEPGKYFEQLNHPPRPCHAAYLELSKYYIAWYKAGAPPKIERDAIFAFYRTHPKDAVAKADPKPVKSFHGEVRDEVYVTTMIPSSTAELRVKSGPTESVVPVGPGIAHHRVPFQTGAQHFEVWRDGRRILALDGPPISGQIEHYDFFTASAYAVSPAR